MTNLVDRLSATFRPHNSAPLVAMVSGGGDSVALLALLEELGLLGRVTVLHVNHLLRGADAEADEQFVLDLATSLGVDCRTERVDIASAARESGGNLEDVGRRARYAAAETLLDQLCADADVHPSLGRVLTAHTRDDRVETFFARAISGAGTGALGSIKRERGRIVRPLLDIDRAELREYLEGRGISWCEDASNSDTARERAFIRHRIVPAAEELNPAVRSALARTMDLLVDDDALLQRMADAFARDFADDWSEGEFISLNLGFLRTLEPTMARRTIRTALLKTFPEMSRIDYAHIARLTEAVLGDGGSFDLPDGIRAEVARGVLRLSRSDAGATSGSQVLGDHVLAIPGETGLGEHGVLLVTTLTEDVLGQLSQCAAVAVIDADALLGTLSVGPVRQGERMTPLGLEGTKKLSDIFVDAKVPRDSRHLVPVVRDGRNIVWVAGMVLDDRYRVTEATVRAHRIEWIQAGE